MSELTLNVADDQTVEIRGHGDLSVQGTDGDVIRIFGVGDDNRPEINSDGDTFQIGFHGDGRLEIPRRVTVRIAEANGDLDVRGREAPVEIHDVSGNMTVERVTADVHFRSAHGDASLRGIIGEVTGGVVSGDLMIHRVSGAVSLEKISGDASLEAIGGDVAVQRIDGDLRVDDAGPLNIGTVSGDGKLMDLREQSAIEQVGGDLDLRDCQGSVAVDRVGANFSGRNLAGGLRASLVGGDAKMTGEFTPGNVYDLTCRGSAVIVMSGDPFGASVAFDLRRGAGGSIKVELPLSNVTQGSGTLIGQLGAGAAIVRVTSGGDLKVSASGAGRERSGIFEDFAGQLRAEITKEIGSGLEAAFGSSSRFGGTDLGERIREKTARASQRAEERVRRGEENARRNAERAEQRAQDASRRVAERLDRRGWNWRTPPPPPRPAPPPRPQVSDKERLAILQMLADGKIGTDDAARLLEALGE